MPNSPSASFFPGRRLFIEISKQASNQYIDDVLMSDTFFSLSQLRQAYVVFHTWSGVHPGRPAATQTQAGSQPAAAG